MKELGQRCFENTVYINFENNERMKNVFELDYDIRRIIFALKYRERKAFWTGKYKEH